MVDWDRVISLVLRYGVVTSAALITLGLILIILRGCSELLSPTSPVNTSAVTLTHALMQGPLSLVLLGLILLIATPILRVILGFASFISERNWVYVVITAVVLLNIALSLSIIPSTPNPHPMITDSLTNVQECSW